MTDELPLEDERRTDHEIEKMLDHYNRREPDMTTRLSFPTDEYESREAFVDEMNEVADELREHHSGHCEDVKLRFAESGHHDNKYFHCQFVFVLARNAPKRWVGAQMRRFLESDRGPPDHATGGDE